MILGKGLSKGMIKLLPTKMNSPVFLAVALPLCLSFLAACANKSDGASSGPVATDASKKAPPTATPTPAPNLGKNLPGPKVPNAGDDASKDAAGAKKTGQERQSQATRSQAAQVPTVPANYSAAANDYAAVFYREKLATEKNADKSALNKRRSAQILGAELLGNQDGPSQMILRLHGFEYPFVLSGTKALSGRSQVASKGGSKNSVQVTANLSCIDERRGEKCENQVANIHFKENGIASEAIILFRTSRVVYSARFPEQTVNDAYYNQFMQLLKNSDLASSGSHRIKTMRMDTAEVINGRSFGSVSIVSQANDLIVWNFPVVKLADNSADDPEDKSEDSAGSELMPGVGSNDVSFEAAALMSRNKSFNTRLSESFSRVELVDNDGHGKMTLHLRMKCLEGLKFDHIEIVLDRVMSKVKF